MSLLKAFEPKADLLYKNRNHIYSIHLFKLVKLHVFLSKKNVYKKMSLKNPKILRKC